LGSLRSQGGARRLALPWAGMALPFREQPIEDVLYVRGTVGKTAAAAKRNPSAAPGLAI